MNLRDSFIQAHGGKPAAVGDLCDHFDVKRNRAGEWLNGKRLIPVEVQDYMRARAIEWAILKEKGRPPENVDRLVRRLTA